MFPHSQGPVWAELSVGSKGAELVGALRLKSSAAAQFSNLSAVSTESWAANAEDPIAQPTPTPEPQADTLSLRLALSVKVLAAALALPALLCLVPAAA
eukprot:3597966-Rhodomonas_salina.1